MTQAEEIGRKLQSVDGPLMGLLGMELVSIVAGKATIQMTVREDMLNGGGACQGGLIFALADQAFAYACMSGNQLGVTLSADVVFNNPARLGDLLSADATVLIEGGRTATCDVVVRNQADTTIAHFRGVHYRIKQTLL